MGRKTIDKLRDLSRDPSIRKLVDEEWYRTVYRDIDVNPIDHYVRYGLYEGRVPTPLFAEEWYVQTQMRGARTRQPFTHFLTEPDVRPNPLLDPNWINGEASRPWKALADYQFSAAQHTRGLQPHPLFDPDWYLNRNADVRIAGIEPLRHFLEVGGAELREPTPYFEPVFYHSQIVAAGISLELSDAVSLLLHYLDSGWKHGLRPSRLFDQNFYVAQCVISNVPPRGAISPLEHYVRFGRSLGIRRHPVVHSEGDVAVPIDLLASQDRIRESIDLRREPASLVNPWISNNFSFSTIVRQWI